MTRATKSIMKPAYERYLRASDTELWEVYSDYSTAKARAMHYCEELCLKYKGDNTFILGHNCMSFSVGFVGEIHGKEAFFYITRDYDRYIYLDDIK